MKALFLAALALAFLPVKAHAYIDPGAGSMMLQALIGIAIGLFLRFRAFLGRATSALLSRMRKKGE